MATAPHAGRNGTRGPYAKTAAKRAAIGKAAFEVVEEVGHDGLTTAAVAERADLSERTLTYHFPTRDHLLVAALTHFNDSIQERTALPGSAAWPTDGDLATTEQVETIVHNLLRGTASDRGYLRLYVYLVGRSQQPGSAAHAYFREHYAIAREGMALIMRLLQEAGLARTDRDPEDQARQFLATWEGLQQQWVVMEDFDLEAATLRAFLDVTGHDVLRTRTAVEELLQQL
ncbi:MULTISPECIES: TetR/AcrR family transcriptional regulator [unclassified Actinomyces]|uniref:TetR/AcrR family transcriptional regulator n=1 Tax=unclassified Actinomyces TaxID=2609248 RepID=UPI0020174A94|nr:MULTISPECIES: TetR/AcrR family transcriptional regulator [unclassified Actinomyces]MCL3777407.1 TetR/AcrR family transcriptional regulator [Actinomyces sp. AC-20-1]MCL3789071.1 TetR/AcrR family transcriptional regulator [Actinomyces sp. 187325]MCL3792798.1 TetR/AcrR family transcriptional regulator [Actinomyces sp. 186855]MCL3793872.1 TetR/AcrR family transcriptional regulator [Actinomyces sp. 217892]